MSWNDFSGARAARAEPEPHDAEAHAVFVIDTILRRSFSLLSAWIVGRGEIDPVDGLLERRERGALLLCHGWRRGTALRARQ
jgi:hypothetical protein